MKRSVYAEVGIIVIVYPPSPVGETVFSRLVARKLMYEFLVGRTLTFYPSPQINASEACPLVGLASEA
jgi:hypothetical protein